MTNKNILILLFILLVSLMSQNASAQVYKDVTVTVESNTAQTLHGYVEYRVTVTNASPKTARKISLNLPMENYGNGDHIRSLKRTVVVAPASTAKVSLFQPPLGMYGNNMSVMIDGRLQKNAISVSIVRNRMDWYGHTTGKDKPFCVLLSRSVSFDDFKNGLDKFHKTPASTKTSGRRSSSYSQQRFVRSEMDIAAYSHNWLSYSGYDAVVLSADDINTMPMAAKTAIRKYINAGGNLLVLGKWQPPLSFNSQESANPIFQAYNTGFGKCIIDPNADVKAWSDKAWEYLIGNVWGYTQTNLHRTTISDANKKYPVVDGLAIPIRGLFTCVVFFAVFIGPVNLFVLSKKKRRIWMLWTVPLLAVITSVSVFAYSLFAEGFDGYIKGHAVTILDENTQTATTIGIQAYYMPLTPSDGLHFSYETEVTPLAVQQWGAGTPRTINFSHDQHLESGWISSRVPAHMMFRKSQLRRERVQLATDPQGQTTALNGLGKDIAKIWYADNTGKIFSAENIPAGQKISLSVLVNTKKQPANPSAFNKLYATNILNHITEIQKAPHNYLRPNTYLVILNDSLFIEEGLTRYKSKEYQQVIFGIIKGAPDAG